MAEPLACTHRRDGLDAPSASELDAFALALIGEEAEAALSVLLTRGPASWLRREVFGPAARRLGDWWVSDRICFFTVTLGMAYLQRLFLAHGRAAPNTLALHPPLALAAMPGEQHTFGLNLLMEELRDRGVEAALLPCPTRETLTAAAASGRFAVIGLSVGCETRLSEVASLVQALRRAAPDRIRLVLGGPAIEEMTLAGSGVDEILSRDIAVDRLCALAAQGTVPRAAAA
jgi:methylmalonyl-CoA mutase cobalamin-binding subunit